MADHIRLRSPRPKVCEHEAGSMLVEFALVAPLLLLLLFGIIDFSLVMFNYIAVRQGTNAGAREAAVIATNPAPPAPSTCPTAGTFTGATLDLICFTKSRIGLNEANTRVSIWFSTQNCNGPTCYVAGAPVVVCTQSEASSATGMFARLLNHVTLASKVEISIESSASDPSLVPAQETPLTGTWPADCSTP